MRHDILSISLQQIQIFLKCYQYKNFSRVAEEYNFTPSMISKTIMALEENLGVQLFIRQYHNLEPTTAATELAKGWKNIYDQVMSAVVRACTTQKIQERTVKIGLLETTKFCADYISLKLENELEDQMAEHIQWERRDMHTLAEALNEDEFDLVITWSGEVQYLDKKTTIWKKIFSSPDALFIPRGHPLFEKGITSFSECEPYSFITLSPTSYPHYYEYLKNVCSFLDFHLFCLQFAGVQTQPDTIYLLERVCMLHLV